MLLIDVASQWKRTDAGARQIQVPDKYGHLRSHLSIGDFHRKRIKSGLRGPRHVNLKT
ncbi:MAG: hypothetical protein ACR2OA_00825 [Rubripirellula sp.]